MKNSILISVIGLALVSASTKAQEYHPIELGVDAGVTIGLGDNSVTVINIPVQAFRIGFFLDRHVSLEPKVALNTVTGSGDTFTSYLAELGLLYHFYREGERRGRVIYPGPGPRSSFYVRPFVGIVGSNGPGDDDSDAILGAGVGMKVPLINRLAARFEANFAHQFGDPDFNTLGLLAGLSFFTR
jgi:outer membrane protein with beta-barrel domain